MHKRGLFLLFQLLLIFGGINSATADIDISQRKIYLNDSMDKCSVGLVLDYLEDKDNLLKIEDILRDARGNKELRWTKSDRKTFEFGFTSSSYWVRFAVVNPYKKEISWALEVDYPHINSIELYKFAGENHLEIKKAGNSLPFKDRDLVYRNFVFNQTQQQETQSTYYMRFRTTGSMDISLWAWSPTLLSHKIHNETILFGMYYGILLLVSLFTLLSFFTTKNRPYLFFSTWIIGFGFYQLSVNGLSFQYFWPNSIKWESISIYFFVLLATICGLQYGRTFLDLKNNLPREDKFMKSLIFLSAAGMISVFIFPPQMIIIIVFLDVVFVLRLMLIAKFSKRTNPFLSTRFYAAGWIVLIIGISAFSLKSIGLVSANFITNWGQQIASLCHIIFIGIALSRSIKTISREKKDAQVKAINALVTAASQKDEFLAQTTTKNIEIEQLNAELKKHILDLNSAKEKISISEEKYRILVEGSNDIIFSLDGNFKFLNVNKAIFSHLKIKPEEVRSKYFLDIIYESKERVSVLRQFVQEKFELFAVDKDPVSFKTEFQVAFTSEPKEMRVYLEYVNIEGRNEIIGKAIRVEDDLLVKYVESEKQHLIIENYFITAEDISHRVTRNLVKYMDQKKVYVLRIALREIIINAIEHGNLDLSFEEKGRLIDEDKYFAFIAERQKDPKYKNRRVQIEYSIDPQKVTYQITDEGDGFDHKKLFQNKPLDTAEEMRGHGRGISMAKNCFDEINYNDKGNRVVLIKYFS